MLSTKQPLMKFRRRSVLAFALAVALAGAGCSAPSGPTRASMEFWDVLRIGGDEVEGWPTIGEMKASADAVVLGRFVSFALNRVVAGDAAESSVGYGAAEVQVAETISGITDGEPITLEFVLPGTAGDFEAVVKDLETSLPEGEILLFLREKRGTGEAGLFRLVNSNGLWATTARSDVDAPLADALVGETYESEVGEFSSLDQLVDYVKSL